MSEGRALTLLLVGVLVMLLPAVVARDLWAPDEPRYAEVSRETLVDGQWWHPHVNGRPYRDKPPLYFWLAAAVSAPWGDVTPATARLPALAAFLLALALTADLARRVVGRDAGRVAGAVLATTWLAAWMGGRVNLDVPLMACTVVTLWSLGRAAAGPGRAHGWGALAGLATAAGLMTKGPVLLLFTAAGVLPLAWHPQVEAGVRRRVGTALGVAALVAAAALVAWLVPARVLGGYDPFGILSEHVVGRAVGGLDHAQPPWYYLGTLPGDLAPWSLLAVPALVAAWRTRAWRRPETAFVLAWALLPLVVLSVIVEKRNIYLVPTLPAWALLVAWHVRSADEGSAPRRGVAVGAGLAAGVLVLLGLASAVGATLGSSLPPLRDVAALPGARVHLALVAAAGLTGGVAVLAAVRRRASARTLALALALATGGVELTAFALLPRLDTLKSARAVGAAVGERVGDGPAAFYPGGDTSRWAAYVFYARRTFAETGDAADLAAWLATVPRPAHVLTYRRDLATLPPDGDVAPAVMLEDEVGHRTPVLVRYEH